MILQTGNGLHAKSAGYKWTLRGRKGSLRLPGSGKGTNVLDFGSLANLDAWLRASGLVAPSSPRPLTNVTEAAEEIEAALLPAVQATGASVSFGGGGFLITPGMGDYILSNPTMEVGRLPLETDAKKRRTIVAFVPTLRSALLDALERTMQACDMSLPFGKVGPVAAGLAAALWQDLTLNPPHETPANAARVAAGVKDRLRGIAGNGGGRGKKSEAYPCLPARLRGEAGPRVVAGKMTPPLAGGGKDVAIA